MPPSFPSYHNSWADLEVGKRGVCQQGTVLFYISYPSPSLRIVPSAETQRPSLAYMKQGAVQSAEKLPCLAGTWPPGDTTA